jgi:hypothetical protein
MNPNSLRKTFTLIFSIGALLSIAIGLSFAVHSPLFLVQVVEVGDQPETAPVDPQTISTLAAVPVGQVNLFDLDLKEVEKRILSHPWIRSVTLVKRFPQTLSIHVIFREPHALFQNKSGDMAYVDGDGRIFGRVNVLARSDLPLISGIDEKDGERIRETLRLIDAWEKSDLNRDSQLSSLNWEKERGYRAWIVYSTQGSRARTVVDLGTDLGSAQMGSQFHRLDSVIRYLSQHDVAANQIWADSGKKIVVRTVRGS